MKNIISKFPYLLMLIMPFSLITGPAVPDLSIFFVGLSFLYLLLFKKKFLEIFQYKWVLISILFWLFLIFISILSENKYLAYRDAVIFIRILFIPIFIYFWILVDKNKIQHITLVIFLAIILVCLDTIYQYTNYDPITGFGRDIFNRIPDLYGRLTGPFKDLVPGAYVSKFYIIGLAFILLYISNKNLQKTLIIIYLTLAGITTYISGERMAFATFILGLCLLIIFLNKKKLTFIISLITIIISLLIINKTHPFYNDYKILKSEPYHLGLKVEKYYKCNESENKCNKIIYLQPKFFDVLKEFKYSAYGEIYYLSLKMLKDHLFQGIGLNNFNYLCKNDPRYRDTMKNIECVTHPHNFYLQWLVETGVFGLILFLSYIFLIFKFVFRRIDNSVSILSLITLIILFWPIMSTGSLLKNWMGVSTFYIIGICLALSNIRQKIL